MVTTGSQESETKEHGPKDWDSLANTLKSCIQGDPERCNPNVGRLGQPLISRHFPGQDLVHVNAERRSWW